MFKEERIFCPPNLSDQSHPKPGEVWLWPAAAEGTSSAESFKNWVLGAGQGRVWGPCLIPSPEKDRRKKRQVKHGQTVWKNNLGISRLSMVSFYIRRSQQILIYCLPIACGDFPKDLSGRNYYLFDIIWLQYIYDYVYIYNMYIYIYSISIICHLLALRYHHCCYHDHCYLMCSMWCCHVREHSSISNVRCHIRGIFTYVDTKCLDFELLYLRKLLQHSVCRLFFSGEYDIYIYIHTYIYI